MQQKKFRSVLFSHIVSCIEYSLRKYPHVHTYDRPPEDKHPETTTNQRTLARLRL
jgi:hypothetical protein